MAQQPVATDDCQITDNTPTEREADKPIGVRQYGCLINSRHVVFTVSIPSLCAKMACGLIVDQHGAGMDADMEDAGTNLREYGRQAMSRGARSPYIVVQPNMPADDDVGWNIFTYLNNISYEKDVAALRYFLSQAMSRFDIDARRVHLHGFSRGAIMSNVIYCDKTDNALFASYATSAGSIVACRLDKPLMTVNGMSDFNHLLAEATIDRFVLEGAKPAVISQDPNWTSPQAVTTGDATVTTGREQHLRYVAAGRLLESITHSASSPPYGGHCLPRKIAAPEWLVCPATFDVGQEVIDFFIANPKP
ncbi:MAG: hypothetical protein QM749_00890 [Aquabacterium sp.]